MAFHPAQHALTCGIAGKFDGAFLYLEAAAVADNRCPVSVPLAHDADLLCRAIGTRCLARAVEGVRVVEKCARRVEEIQIFFCK
ncbi:UNVERIFIED_ORG: hypothetical protein J2W19_002906 [Shinella zoogloeoides]|nr:hypothetical protein [Shinella zoogloeoides]